jgi:DNA-binding LacI/PurR family transcriptional regulator
LKLRPSSGSFPPSESGAESRGRLNTQYCEAPGKGMSDKSRSSRATSFDVAALAGVSQSAVSRAFTPGSSIADDTREKVIAAARKLNYVPNSIASSLTTKRTNIVALILGNLANPFYVQALHEFSVRLQARGRQVLIFTVDPGAESDDAIMRALQYQIDGIILTAAQLSTRMTTICHQRGIPIVLFNRYIPGSDASGVRCDNVAGGKMIAEAFLGAGAKTFAMITGDPRGTTSQDRVRGFVERLIEQGIKRRQIIEIAGGSTYDGAVKAVRTLFGSEHGRRPDALFAVNDIMAMGAMDTLRYEHGLRIPDDLMVAGFDDIPDGARPSYNLTTVRQPIDRMVEETLSILHLEQPHRPIERGIDRLILGEFVWRGTVPRRARKPKKPGKTRA